MKNKKAVYILLIAILGVFLYYVFFNKEVEFVKLKCYDEIKSELHSNHFILVKNPPYFSSNFEDELNVYISQNSHLYLNRNGASKIIFFITESERDFLTKYIWGDNEHYSDCTAEIDSEDFLARVLITRDNKIKIKIYTD